MRMEGKNSFCKRAAQKSNFKNVPYTVAKRHQHLLCAYLNSGNFFDRNLECGPGEHALCIHVKPSSKNQRLSTYNSFEKMQVKVKTCLTVSMVLFSVFAVA